MRTVARESKRKLKKGLDYQTLETRNLLAVITFDDTTGTIQIEGSPEADEVIVSNFSESEIVVDCVGVETMVFDIEDVSLILFHGRQGDDVFRNQTNIVAHAFGFGGDDDLTGGSNNDRLVGGGGNDRIFGNGGNDNLRGGTGNDHLEGGDGDDEITGFTGDDFIDGREGNDLIFGGDGNDEIHGGLGNDEIAGQGGDDLIRDLNDPFQGTFGDGDDVIYGNDGNDRILSGSGADQVFGGAGDDEIESGSDPDVVFGGPGNDTLRGGEGHDMIYGNDGNDHVSGGQRGDVIYGGAGDDDLHGGSGGLDILFGGIGNDKLVGGDGRGFERLFGGDGDDYLVGSFREDVLLGGAGNDELEGGAGADEIFGGDGNDLIKGGDGDDLLAGQEGRDSIAGGPDNDMIYGGPGNDYLRGGGGDDLIAGNEGHDRAYGAGGTDQLYGGPGIDGLAAGPAGQSGPDLMHGGAETDRFLLTSDDIVVDLDDRDVQIIFRNSDGRKWRHGEIQAVDLGIQSLHLQTGNKYLLQDSSTENPIVFQKVADLPDSLHLGQNSFNAQTMERVISFKEFDFANSNMARQIELEVAREMAFNWASDDAIFRVLPDQSSLFSDFEALSSWTAGPVENEDEFILSDDGSQYYSVDANFADDALATFNSAEDFASIWRLNFESGASTDGLVQKIALVDLLFSRIALL